MYILHVDYIHEHGKNLLLPLKWSSTKIVGKIFDTKKYIIYKEL